MPKKYDRCVRKVRKSLKKTGKKGNPYAICRKTLSAKKVFKSKPIQNMWDLFFIPKRKR